MKLINLLIVEIPAELSAGVMSKHHQTTAETDCPLPTRTDFPTHDVFKKHSLVSSDSSTVLAWSSLNRYQVSGWKISLSYSTTSLIILQKVVTSHIVK